MNEQDWARTVTSTVGSRVAQLRKVQGLSAQRLADKIGALGHDLSRSSLSQLELGNRGVTLPDLLALATALEVSPVLLLVDPDSDSGPGIVEHIPGAEVDAGEFVDWWAGETPWSESGQLRGADLEAWHHGMNRFRLWQKWRASEESVLEHLEVLAAAHRYRTTGGPVRNYLELTKVILGDLHNELQRQERQEVALPWLRDDPATPARLTVALALVDAAAEAGELTLETLQHVTPWEAHAIAGIRPALREVLENYAHGRGLDADD